MVGYGFFCENVDRLADDDDEDYCCSQKEIKIKAHNRSQRLAAQADHLKTMSHRFGKNSKEDYDISKQFFKLPFRCDDMNVIGGYPGTGFQEKI